MWESLAAKRKLNASLRQRWIGNFSIYFISVAATRLALPGIAFTASYWASARDFGLFNLVEAPWWIVFPAVLLSLDLVRYASHRALHTIPVLWRVHSMHHTDQDYDFTTSFRFHPLESIFFYGLVMATVVLLGAPIAAIALTDLLFVFISVMSHGNIVIAPRVEAFVRRLFVTPDMHRIHHSQDFRESNSNFSNLFSFWDRAFGTYVAEPKLGQLGMKIGLEGCEDPRYLNLGQMLAQPFLPPVPFDTGRTAGLREPGSIEN